MPVIRRTTVVGLTGVALLGAAPAAHAGRNACPEEATITASGRVINYEQTAPEGETLVGSRLHRGGHFYELEGSSAAVKFGRNTYKISRGAIFKLGCYGRSRSAPLWPDVELLTGEVRVTTRAPAPGGVSTEEGLFDPRSTAAMTYTVKRTLSQTTPLTPEEKLTWFANLSDQPTGTTDVRSRTRAIIGVTPYVGSRPGNCRYVKRAVLTTKRRFGNGTARYYT